MEEGLCGVEKMDELLCSMSGMEEVCEGIRSDSSSSNGLEGSTV